MDQPDPLGVDSLLPVVSSPLLTTRQPFAGQPTGQPGVTVVVARLRPDGKSERVPGPA